MASLVLLTCRGRSDALAWSVLLRSLEPESAAVTSTQVLSVLRCTASGNSARCMSTRAETTCQHMKAPRLAMLICWVIAYHQRNHVMFPSGLTIMPSAGLAPNNKFHPRVVWHSPAQVGFSCTRSRIFNMHPFNNTRLCHELDQWPKPTSIT